MNHVDFLKVCQCKHDYITISTDEKERLEKVWKKNGQNWEWIWNDSEECYYPQFFEPTDNDEQEIQKIVDRSFTLVKKKI